MRKRDPGTDGVGDRVDFQAASCIGVSLDNKKVRFTRTFYIQECRKEMSTYDKLQGRIKVP